MSQTGKKEWYGVLTFSGQENTVAENLLIGVKANGLEDTIFRVVVCNEEQRVIDKNGKPKMIEDAEGKMIEKTKIINLYPGYIFVEAIMDEKTWFFIRNSSGVTGICGSSGKGRKPTPIPARDMESILKKAGIVDQDMYKDYVVGGNAKIINGTLAGLEGKIVNINRDTNTVKISVVFFGKVTEIELEFTDIVKV